MMVWNVFLALLPLLFSLQFRSGMMNPDGKHVWWRGLLWLLFFPNAPYMITDFIHIQGITFYASNAHSPTVYSTDITVWISLVHIGIGVFLGTCAGMLSFYFVYQAMVQSMGKETANIAVILISLISGYAIYVGRFLRFNSWDIIRPAAFFSQLFSHVNLFSVSVSLLFSLYILLIFWLFEIFFTSRR